MAEAINGVYTIGDFVLDTNTRELTIAGESRHVPKREYQLLCILVENSHTVVEKDVLTETLWPEIFVQEDALTKAASELRKILGREGAIKNVNRVGYRFMENVFFETGVIECPWQGFEVYTEHQAHLFHGRKSFVNHLIKRFQEKPYFLTLFGHSGIGKSSLVRAGFIPRLQKSVELGGSGTWDYLALRPSRRPLWKLSSKLATLTAASIFPGEEDIEDIFDRLQANPAALHDLLPKDPDFGLFVFVDQLEDLLASDVERQEANAFTSTLLELANCKSCKGLVLCLNNSFLVPFSESYKELSRALISNMEMVVELDREELKSVIDNPAKERGLVLDAGLSDEIVAEIIDNSAALPLLSAFLVELFEFRDGNRLTLEHYRISGGVKSSISRHADAVFDALSEQQVLLAESLFLMLVDIGDTPATDRCRRVEIETLVKRFGERKPEVEAILDRLASERLLVISSDLVTGKRLIEVPHVSLFKNWKRMQEMLNDKRGALLVAKQLELDAATWLANDCKSADLLKGTKLRLAEDMAAQLEPLIGPQERSFFDESKKEEAAENRKRANRQLAKWAAILGIPLVIFVVGSILRSNSRISEAKEIAEARSLLDRDPAKALEKAIGAADLQDETSLAIVKSAVATSHLRKILRGHKDALKAVAISPNGELLVTASRDQRARIWDGVTGKLIRTLEGHAHHIESAAFSPDNKLVVTGAGDATARIWDVADGRELKKVTLDDGVNNVAFSPDGNQILIAGEGRNAKLWNFNESDTTVDLVGHTDYINSAVYNRAGTLIASASGDKSARVWKVGETTTPIVLAHKETVLNVAFSPNGKQLATVSRDGIVRMWNTENWSLIADLVGHSGRVNCVAFDSKGKRIVTASMDQTVMVWDWRSEKILYTLRGHTGPVTSAVFSPDDRFIISSSADTEARIWDIGDDFVVRNLVGHTGPVSDTAFDVTGSQILTAGSDGTARTWDAATGNHKKAYPDSSSVVYAKFGADVNSFVTATADGRLNLWDVGEGKIVRTFGEPSGVARPFAISRDGSLLAAGDETGKVTLWEMANGNEVRTFGYSPPQAEPQITAVSFSEDGKSIAASSQDRTVKFWNVELGTDSAPAVWIIGTGAVHGVFIGGSSALAPCDDKSIRFWDRSKNSQAGMLFGHTERVLDAEFSPDLSFVVSGSEDGTLRIWSKVLEKSLYRIDAGADLDSSVVSDPTGALDDVLSVSFSPNGGEVVYSTRGGVVRISRCPVCAAGADELVAMAKAKLPAKMEY